MIQVTAKLKSYFCQHTQLNVEYVQSWYLVKMVTPRYRAPSLAEQRVGNDDDVWTERWVNAFSSVFGTLYFLFLLSYMCTDTLEQTNWNHLISCSTAILRANFSAVIPMAPYKTIKYTVCTRAENSGPSQNVCVWREMKTETWVHTELRGVSDLVLCQK